MYRKKISVLLCFLLIFCIPLAACSQNDLTKVKVAEVTHSVFYAPQYVAITEGFFKEEGLDVTLVNGQGADKTMTALLSDHAT